MHKTNTIVVGQGIAGSLVAYMLHLRKVPFIVIDPGFPNTCSRIAAGMFTPVTGKRKTIHPMAPVQIPFAMGIYQDIGRLLGINILHLLNILELHKSPGEERLLQASLSKASLGGYLVDSGMVGFEITQSGWVNCRRWLDLFALWLKQQHTLITASFCYDNLQASNSKMKYPGIEFDNIIFCEGWGAVGNPFFREQQIIPCKGDLLTIRYDGPAVNRIIKKQGIYVIPLGEQLYRVGSTYLWGNDDPNPDPASRKIIEDHLDGLLGRQYITVDHQSAIRPTTANREVITAQHPQIKGMYMLNGLGTRGVLQGPWFAKKIVEFCLDH